MAIGIESLPAKLLCLIFWHTLSADFALQVPHPRQSPILLTNVCGHWRNVASNESSLWSTLALDLSKRSNKDMVDTWLGRARGRPLDLIIHTPYTYDSGVPNDELARALRAHSNRWRNFEISGGMDNVQSIMLSIRDLVSSLVSLTITTSFDEDKEPLDNEYTGILDCLPAMYSLEELRLTIARNHPLDAFCCDLFDRLTWSVEDGDKQLLPKLRVFRINSPIHYSLVPLYLMLDSRLQEHEAHRTGHMATRLEHVHVYAGLEESRKMTDLTRMVWEGIEMCSQEQHKRDGRFVYSVDWKDEQLRQASQSQQGMIEQ
ncbi:hypothetical protein PLICRDRAFT_361548 [Plicaturopsis crispa FD-325 SS-3]|uniref:F-box domain-containing protein n=1 Tax=Plicaturopsis crispa FD-325 SS-3 TaxID=944288 RepID=A0A0C9SXF3_PLICR|nr:hypothetical protein PLICRDRAFT_361548 [Plicaturopsis crispa FD-325 SS-3]